MDSINLADLAGLDMTNVEEVRFGEKLPEGIYTLEIDGPRLEDDKVTDDGKEIQRLKAFFPLKVVDVTELKDPTISQDSREKLIGKAHTHTIFRKMLESKDLETFVGAIKAYLVDCGLQGNGPIGALMQAANGHRFKVPVKYGKNKEDPENPYVNLVMAKAVAVAKAA